MAIRNWHWGKIVMLWIAAALPWAIGFMLSADGGGMNKWSPDQQAAFLMTVWFLIFVIPAAAFIVTWKWLGGKEAR